MAKTLVYEMYPIAWRSGFSQMTKHLTRVQALGADYVWLAPVYPSPRYDHGYDISDYCAIDHRFGGFDAFTQFVSTAHSLGIKVLMDLVLNHTSVEHPWFCHPWKMLYYCRLTTYLNRPGWKNLFSPMDSPLFWDWERRAYYLSLFHPKQADLYWFPGGKLSEQLVGEFRQIVDFWLRRGVDGFRLDAVQALNKDLTSDTINLESLMFGDRAVDVINAVFDQQTTLGGDKPFLIAEIFDPTYGDIVDYYSEASPVDYCMNMLVKQNLDSATVFEMYNIVAESIKHHGFMLDLENHDSPRCLSRLNANHNIGGPSEEAEFAALTFPNPDAICIYQGQELGLRNPTEDELSDRDMLMLDAQASMRRQSGADLAELRHTSRANARVPLPLEKYAEAEADPDSFYNQLLSRLSLWRKS